jgi:F-type H+-transporting ATPase subunit delta
MESIASRYGLALYKLAEEAHELSEYLSLLETLQGVVKKDTKLIRFLTNAFYDRHKKYQLIDQVFPDTTWKLIPSFLKTLVKNHRILNLEAIVDEAILLCQKATNIKKGVAFTTVPMTPQQLSSLQDKLSKTLDIALELSNVIDPSLIGGIRVDIEGKVFDGSLLSQLAALRQSLLKRGR